MVELWGSLEGKHYSPRPVLLWSGQSNSGHSHHNLSCWIKPKEIVTLAFVLWVVRPHVTQVELDTTVLNTAALGVHTGAPPWVLNLSQNALLLALLLNSSSMCPTYSEAKQTQRSEFGAQKGLLNSHSRRMGGSCSKDPNSLMVFRETFFIGKIWGEGCRVHDVLPMGWQWGNRDLVISLKLPSFTWVGALVPAEKLEVIVMYIPWGGTRILPHGCAIVSWLPFLCFCIPSLS